MFRSYLRLAARTLRRRLGYTAVNALGLTVGLACCALVAVFLQYELTYDAHHDDAERIYRLISSQPGDEDFSTILFGRGSERGDAQRAYAEQLVAEIPEIEQATNYVILDDPQFVTTEGGATFESERQLVTNTGPAFADLFSFERAEVRLFALSDGKAINGQKLSALTGEALPGGVLALAGHGGRLVVGMPLADGTHPNEGAVVVVDLVP